MTNVITIKNGHKMATKVTNRKDYLAIRNSVSNIFNVDAARLGDADAKKLLVQMAYNDLMPDGKVAGCCPQRQFLPRHRLLRSLSFRTAQRANSLSKRRNRTPDA